MNAQNEPKKHTKEAAAGCSRSANEAHPEHAPRADRLYYCSQGPQASITHGCTGRREKRPAGGRVRVKSMLVYAQGAAHVCLSVHQDDASHRCVSLKNLGRRQRCSPRATRLTTRKKPLQSAASPGVGLYTCTQPWRPPLLPSRQKSLSFGFKALAHQPMLGGRLERATRPCHRPTNSRPSSTNHQPTNQPG